MFQLSTVLACTWCLLIFSGVAYRLQILVWTQSFLHCSWAIHSCCCLKLLVVVILMERFHVNPDCFCLHFDIRTTAARWYWTLSCRVLNCSFILLEFFYDFLMLWFLVFDFFLKFLQFDFNIHASTIFFWFFPSLATFVALQSSPSNNFLFITFFYLNYLFVDSISSPSTPFPIYNKLPTFLKNMLFSL